MSKDSFKEFVRNNDYLVDYVNNNNTSWQKIYEVYDLYGDNKEVWKKYQKEEKTLSEATFKDIYNMIKKIDLESLKKGLTGLEKGIILLQSLNNKENNTKPLYKNFED